MTHLKNAPSWQQSFEPCKFPQLNKAFAAPDVRLSSSVELSPEIHIQLQSFCKNRDVSLESVLQTTWALVLRCYVGSDATLFGYHTGPASGSHTLCGDQFNLTDPIEKHLTRTAQSGEGSSIATCMKVEEGAGETLDHDIFNSVVVFSDDQTATADRPELKSYPIIAHFNSSKDALSIKVEHDCSLFDEAQGQRVANTTHNILLKVISNPSQTIGDLSSIHEEDLKQIWEWNHEIPEDPKLCAHHLFEQQAQRTPDAQAIKSWDGEMTFAELEKLSSTLGGYLSAKGVGPNMVIPICFEKCKWTIVAMMAVLKAGAAFTTLDPIQPTNRLEDTIIETRSKLVLAGASQAGRFDVHGWDVMTNIPELCQQPSQPRYTAASLLVQPTDLSYVAFTSGSTGKPKGVAHQHLASCSSITLKSRDGSDSGYGPGKRIMQFASQAFAASVVEILKTLGNGGCICIPSDKVRLNNITEFMKENCITRVFFTPALLKLFKPEQFPTLEILLVGGEPVLPDLIATWAPRLQLIEAIGMTEGVAIQTRIDSEGKMRRVGQTLSGVPWIVDPDDHNKLAPIGALGELMVEGPCLAKGYLHDEEKTNIAFIEAPHWARKVEYPGRKFRLYRTGDMARYYSDGVVKLLGRRDNRVKLNGQRIELGDVETHMQKNLPQSMAVAADVVTISQSGKERSFLVGFIFATTEIGKPNDPEGLLPKDNCTEIISLLPRLKEKMALGLPAYMVPTIFLPLNRRPTNISGKIDRKRLRQIASGLSTEEVMVYNTTETKKTPPSTNIEKAIASLWAKIFNIDAASFGLEDNFLMYGGDSIQAIKLVRLAQASGMSLTTSDILQNPILKSLSLKVKSLAEDTTNGKEFRPVGLTEDTARIQHLVGSYQIEGVSRATDWQSWAVYTGLLKTRGWTDYLTFDFKGSLDVPRLEAACKALLANFGILRTVFVVDRRRVLQIVLKDYPFDFNSYESRSSEEVELFSKQVFDEDAASDTMLGEALVRFSLIKGFDTSRLLMRISHAQYDVISLVSLFSALKDAYRGVELQPSPTFIDFVNFTNENDTVSEPFWRKLLEGSKMTEIIKQDKPTYVNIVDTTLKNTIALPAMQSHGITTASLILSAWAIVLSQLSGNSDVVFGRLTSGRHSTMPGIQEVLGPCMNITPVRAQTTASMTVLNFLQEVQSQHLTSLSYENVGFRHIIEKCTDWPPFTRFSSIVNHVHIEEGMKDLFTLTENLKYDFDVYEPQHDKSDLWLQTKPIGNQLEVELRFSREAISSEVAEKALQLFCDVVQQAAAAFEKPLSLLVGDNTLKVIKEPVASIDIESMVQAAWTEILLGEGEPSDIGMDTPFYCVWGDLVAAAAICKIYRRKGFEVSVEDIIDKPTIREQVKLLKLKGNGL